MRSDAELLLQRINALDRLTDEKFVTYKTMLEAEAVKVQLALDSADKAILKAEIAVEKRFDSVNEFRAALTDQAALFATREALAQVLETSTHDRESLRSEISVIRVAMQDYFTRDSAEAFRDSYDLQHKNLTEQINAVRDQQSRMVGMAIGVSTTISFIAILINAVIRLTA